MPEYNLDVETTKEGRSIDVIQKYFHDEKYEHHYLMVHQKEDYDTVRTSILEKANEWHTKTKTIEWSSLLAGWDPTNEPSLEVFCNNEAFQSRLCIELHTLMNYASMECVVGLKAPSKCSGIVEFRFSDTNYKHCGLQSNAPHMSSRMMECLVQWLDFVLGPVDDIEARLSIVNGQGLPLDSMAHSGRE